MNQTMLFTLWHHLVKLDFKNKITFLRTIGIGSYTELPGGNIQLPYGYVSLLKPLIKSLPSNCIVKDKPIKTIHWKYRVVQEEDGNASDSSVNTVKSVKSTLDT